MTRGSQCARFEVHTLVRGEDMSNLLLLLCYKGGCIVGIISQYTYNTSLGLINIEIILLNHLTISQGGCMGVDTTDFRVCVITKVSCHMTRMINAL